MRYNTRMFLDDARIKFYLTSSGRAPVREFWDTLPAESAAAIIAQTRLARVLWPAVGMPLVRKLEKDLWEVRVNIKGGIARVTFTVWQGDMVLLHSFAKKAQKTPQPDLQVSRARRDKIRSKA